MKPAENLAGLAEASVSRFRDRPLFGERTAEGWRWITYGEWYAHVEQLRGALAQLGVGRGDRVAIVSRNSAAWAAAAYATFGLGATFVPMYEAQRPDDWEFILRDCGAKVVFGRTQAIADAIEDMVPRLPALREVIAIDNAVEVAEAWGRDNPIPISPVGGNDVAAIIYTSGTTGLPKGAMITHRNLIANLRLVLEQFAIEPDDRTVSFLPWAHIYGQGELHILIASGGSTAFCSDTDHLVEDIRDIRPTILVAVPRVFNKMYAGITAQIEHKPRVIRWLFRRGLTASIRRNRGERIGVVDRIVLVLASVLFSAIRRKLGGRLRFAFSASAMLSREVAEMIDGLGITVYEGYGLTECALITISSPRHHKIGTVGKPLPGVVVELDYMRGDGPGEGEIIAHGPSVMRGYHHRPEENVAAFTATGGLHTGDLGRFDEDGFLVITGRIKEQYKLENGKYVMPSPLEEKLALSTYIASVMLYGANHAYNVALVVIDPDTIRAWASREHVELRDDLTTDPHVRDLILRELGRTSAGFRAFERPVDFVLTETPFTIENGLLTPTLKLKRREAAARYQTALEALYDPKPRAIAPATPPVHGPVTPIPPPLGRGLPAHA
jgi:long-chain acyl-CoA synthetase